VISTRLPRNCSFLLTFADSQNSLLGAFQKPIAECGCKQLCCKVRLRAERPCQKEMILELRFGADVSE